jgi:metallophosphoesterase (TIGR00282 family)
MNIFFIGDIVGSPGREVVKALLPQLKDTYRLDFVLANAENAAGGSGITPKIADELFDAGINVLTSGDHIWKKKEILTVIDQESRLLRPLNFPAAAPGKGWNIFPAPGANKIGIVNLQGRVFMQPLECPFKASCQAVEEIQQQTKIILVDIHAEATSEKIALGWYLDGLVSAVMGTHTHVQTADERILPAGTAFISDVGMTGPLDSVIGRRVEDVLQGFLTAVPTRFNVADANVQLQGVVVDIDESTGKARSIVRIQKRL